MEGGSEQAAPHSKREIGSDRQAKLQIKCESQLLRRKSKKNPSNQVKRKQSSRLIA